MTTLFLALLFACAFADAQHFEACQKDRETFCAGASHYELHRCMHDHWAQLGQDCQAAITQFVQEQQAKVQAACGGDMDTFCADVKENFDQLRQCMTSNWASLTQECRDVLSHHRHEEPRQEEPHQEEPHQEEPHPACPMVKCNDDVHTLCPEATTKEAAHDCLKNNWVSLSDECRAAIEEMIRHNNAQGQQAESTSSENMEGMAYREIETTEGEDVETQEAESTSSEGMAYREIETTEGEDVVVVQEDPYLGTTMQSQPTPWYYWFTRLWWTYPVGLVAIIQLLACIRVRQIRKQEAELL